MEGDGRIDILDVLVCLLLSWEVQHFALKERLVLVEGSLSERTLGRIVETAIEIRAQGHIRRLDVLPCIATAKAAAQPRSNPIPIIKDRRISCWEVATRGDAGYHTGARDRMPDTYRHLLR